MQHFNVLYRSGEAKALDVEIFRCQAEDYDHAEEQCENAYPDCCILQIDNEINPEETIKNWIVNGTIE